MKNKNINLLSPTNDAVFQVLFGELGSEEITKGFLESVLNEPITNVDLSQNPIIRRFNPEDKLGILDVLVKFNTNEQCNIEMQVSNQPYFIDRLLYYFAGLYRRPLKKSNNYDKTARTISIAIVDFEVQALKGFNEFAPINLMVNKEHTHICLTKKWEFYIIELPKMKEKFKHNKKLLEWLQFLTNPNSSEVRNIMENNKSIQKAYNKLEEISQDERMMVLADMREDAMFIENTMKIREERMQKMEKKLQDKEQKLQSKKEKLQDKEEKIQSEKEKLQDEKEKLQDEKEKLQDKKEKLQDKEEKNKKMEKRLEQNKKELEKDKMLIEKNKKEIKQKELQMKQKNTEIAKRLLEKGMTIEEIESIMGISKDEILGNI